MFVPTHQLVKSSLPSLHFTVYNNQITRVFRVHPQGAVDGCTKFNFVFLTLLKEMH